ncbi:MAG TPA: hypothetical protein VLE99_01395 [Candidatus Saccharimonadales bacterium]|nr:hypothetical protein [Candidatus Saccharimonadales bacterium]
MPQKEKSAASKIDDVKRPGKATPSASSRPIVVSNRPVLASDPMMVATDATGSKESALQPMTRTAKTIQPLDTALTAAAARKAAEQPLTPSDLASANDKSAGDTSTAIKIIDNSGTDQPLVDTSAAVAETAPPETPELTAKPAAEPVAIIEEPKAKPNPDATPPEPTTAQNAETTDPSETTPLPATTAPSAAIESSDQVKRDQEAELTAEQIAAAEAETARNQELEALVASRKYNAPINARQRKRSRLHVLLLCLLALALAAVLLDAALDAGLVSLPVSVPHTHFLSTPATN